MCRFWSLRARRRLQPTRPDISGNSCECLYAASWADEPPTSSWHLAAHSIQFKFEIIFAKRNNSINSGILQVAAWVFPLPGSSCVCLLFWSICVWPPADGTRCRQTIWHEAAADSQNRHQSRCSKNSKIWINFFVKIILSTSKYSQSTPARSVLCWLYSSRHPTNLLQLNL